MSNNVYSEDEFVSAMRTGFSCIMDYGNQLSNELERTRRVADSLNSRLDEQVRSSREALKAAKAQNRKLRKMSKRIRHHGFVGFIKKISPVRLVKSLFDALKRKRHPERVR